MEGCRGPGAEAQPPWLSPWGTSVLGILWAALGCLPPADSHPSGRLS